MQTGPVWALQLHPDSDASPLERLEVELLRDTPVGYTFRFHGEGDTARLRLPGAATPVRRDALWRHTCAEVFLAGSGAGYCEFNFSPSTQWAAYRFESYRQGMAEQQLVSAPRINLTSMPGSIILDAVVDLTRVISADARAVRVGLAAVIEDVDGAISYWALAHPGEKPDFHHHDGFIAGLPDNVV